jgi:tellurite resistance protein TerC
LRPRLVTGGAVWEDRPMLLADTASVPPGVDLVVPTAMWVGLGVIIVALLLLDLFVVNREAHEISIREAAISSTAWISIGLAYGLVVLWVLGGDAAAQFYAGYIIEKSLSVDNVFVWAVLLGFFAVPKNLQHRVLFWGVFGALILRAVFIFAGVALLNRLTWLVLVFGAFLVFTGIRVGTHDDSEVHPDRNPVLKLMRKRVPMTADYRGPKFFIREHGKRLATPLFAVLVMVEITDVIFAVDSIPAILAISRSQFIVFASNAFAILGLRALYFLLAGLQDKLVYLNKGLGVILVYVGLKMLASFWEVHINIGLSLGFIVVVLAVTVVLSLRASARIEAEAAASAASASASASAATGSGRGDGGAAGPADGIDEGDVDGIGDATTREV